MKPFYEGHDAEYKKRLAAGSRGWDPSDDGYETHQANLTEILAAGRAPKEGKLLELGCGAGNIGLWLAELGYSVFGIDIAPTAVKLAQKLAAASGVDAIFCLGNILDLMPYASDTFDFVYDSHRLRCIIGDDRIQVLASVKRVLKPGGYFLVNTMCFNELSHQIPNFDLATKCTITPEGIASRYIGEENTILQELKNAGFTILSHHRQLAPDGHLLIVEMTTS